MSVSRTNELVPVGGRTALPRPLIPPGEGDPSVTADCRGAAPDRHVAVIAQHAPATIGWLQVPLTPSRAAALAAFTARTGVSAQALVTDLLDDVVFALPVSEKS